MKHLLETAKAHNARVRLVYDPDDNPKIHLTVTTKTFHFELVGDTCELGDLCETMLSLLAIVADDVPF